MEKLRIACQELKKRREELVANLNAHGVEASIEENLLELVRRVREINPERTSPDREIIERVQLSVAVVAVSDAVFIELEEVE